MVIPEKLKHDGAAIAFFALVVATKVYSLATYLGGDARLWRVIEHIDSIEQYGRGAIYFLTTELSYILYFVTALVFDALTLYSFVVRSAAKSRPQGVIENTFPLLTVFIPVVGFTLLFLPQVRQFVPGYSSETLQWLRNITPLYGFYIDMIGFSLGFVGAAFSVWAISHLQKSFGLRPAVRTLVTSGPYRRIRHPLYVGEIIHIFGIAILSATPIGLYLFVLAVAMQIGRAKMEERKFLRALPEYAAYKACTGFLWPRLGRF
jgi:protein-S-isoprenylcysteine O-methyltransferase Ste14